MYEETSEPMSETLYTTSCGTPTSQRSSKADYERDFVCDVPTAVSGSVLNVTSNNI